MTQQHRIEILRYADALAVCEPWNPNAEALAALLSGAIHQGFPGIRVEHIGSTAVPGLPGKGVIDLMVVFESAAELDRARDVLFKLGFQRQRGRDPFPEDRPMRVGAIDFEGQRFRIHVHVIPASSPEVITQIAFRDRLRRDSDFRIQYANLKESIIESGITDSLEYCYAKGAFIERALSESVK